jgi:eukaryotic-like serine/threonine-protein kinase
MVTGQKAFEGDSKLSTLAAILNKNQKPVVEINPTLPRELDRIINHCLRKDPGRRFQHMDDVKELKEESNSGKVAGAQREVRSTRRIWVWAGAAFAVMAIAIATRLLRWDSRKAVLPRSDPPDQLRGYRDLRKFFPRWNQVVFSWNGEKQDNFDIYVK